MADAALKEKKLAAARKKLKKYQRKKDESAKHKEYSSAELLGNQKSESSSRSSSVADVEMDNHQLDSSDLPKSGSSSIGSFPRDPLNNYIVTDSDENPCNDPSYLNSPSSLVEVPYSINDAIVSATNPQSQTIKSSDLNSSSFPSADLTNPGHLNQQQGVPHHDILNNNGAANKDLEKCDSFENEGSVCSETNASMTTVVHVKNKDPLVSHTQQGPLRSTSESLRQLSLQMSGLVSDVESHDQDRHELTIIELEKRNNELASLLETEKQKSFEHNSVINELKRTVESQNNQLQNLQKMYVTENNGTEVNGLREQLQVHIQTIGILVAEKSELQTNLSHTRYALDQKVGEITELQGRLDASREHIKSLESSNHELRNQVSILSESKETESQQVLNLQSNYAKLSKMCDEMRASTAELTERLAVRSEENQKLSNELSEVRRQYELNQVLIEQLRNNSTEDLRNQYHDLQTKFNESQNEIQKLKSSLEVAHNEKKQLEFEYKSYTSQLAAESEDLSHKLSSSLKKLEELEDKNQELEMELKSRKDEPKTTILLEEFEKEKKQLSKTVHDLTETKRHLEESCSSLTRDNKQLSQFVAEQSAKLELLESAAERSDTQQVDTTQLLQAMQSDKIAAARALTQNKQLKEELEELQNGFIMMSNKKLELTEKLEKELHIKKNLYKEISQLGEEVASLKTNLLNKQREIEAFGHSSSLVASNFIGATNGTEPHQTMVNGGTPCHSHEEMNHTCDHEETHHDEHSKFIYETIKNVDELPSKVSAEEKLKESPVLSNSEHESSNLSSVGSQTEGQASLPKHYENNSNQELLNLRAAHEALEKRFLKCMQDIATMSDEKQNLEHLVQQLQLETETVGDYITIYQFQRGVMKQQVQELHTELELLKVEKQETISKLSKLQKLVESLASSADKNALKEGFIHGINSIISAATPPKADDGEKAEGSPSLDISEGITPDDSPTETDSDRREIKDRREKQKNDTVKQIIDLISEMESSTQVDPVALHKFHPCAHCSGRLLTI